MKRLTVRAPIMSVFHRFTLSGFACLLLPVLLSGCATSGGSQALPATAAQAESPAASEMNEDLLFNLLAGEFAGVRGQMDQSIEYYSHAAESSDDPQVILRAAYIALYAGDDERAIELSDRWFKLGLEDNNAINRIRILAFLHLQQLEPAVELIDKQLWQDGEISERGVAALTHILGKETEPAFALQVAQQLNQKHPQQPLLMLLQARFEANLQQLDMALQHVDQVIALDPELTDAYLIRAQVLSGLDRNEEALQAVEQAVNRRPQDHRLHLQYARMLVQSGSYDKALQHFKQLQSDMPDDENVLLSLGLLTIEIGEPENAQPYFQSLLELGVHNQQAHYYLGRIEQAHGDPEKALDHYARVYEGEYWLDAKIRAAGVLAASGQTEDALIQLELLGNQVAAGPAEVRVSLAMGEVLRAASREREAYNLYSEALQQTPDNTDLLYARALTAESLDMPQQAEADLKAVLQLEPENANALNALGYTLADRNERLEEALGYIQKAVELLPDEPAVLDSLGWVHYRLGDYPAAIKWLSKAFELLPDAEIAAHLGEVLWVSGETEKARSIWQKAQQLDGNQSVLRDTIQRFNP
jgi:tetratricopeptide (TPR) repeat protein